MLDMTVVKDLHDLVMYRVPNLNRILRKGAK